MSSPIVLKDSALADQTFNYVGTGANNAIIYERSAPTLVGRARLSLSLSGNSNVNRVRVKMSVPSVCTTPLPDGGCSRPTVEYTQVASADLSVVAFSSAASRADLAAMFGSLISNADVISMITDGVTPRD